MAISFVQTAGSGINPSVALGTIVFPSTFGAGNTIIAAYSSNTNLGSTLTGISDNLGNKYQKILSSTSATQRMDIWYASNIIGGAIGTLVGSVSSTGWSAAFLAQEFSGLAQNSAFDVSAQGTGSGTTVDSGFTPVTTQASELVFVSVNNNNALHPSAPGGYSNGTNYSAGGVYGIGAENKIVSSIGTYSGTMFLDFVGTWNGVTTTFKANLYADTNLVQSAGTSVLASTSPSASWVSPTTTGNMIVVGLAVTNTVTLGTVSAVTDTQGNTYARALRGTVSEATSVIDGEIWYATNIIGGAGSVTATTTLDNVSMYVREYSGKYNYLDAIGSATGATTAVNSGTTGVPSQNNELVIIATADDKGAAQTYTAAGAFGDMVGTTTTLTGISMEDNIINIGGAQTGTQTLGGTANWVSLTATFRRIANPALLSQGAVSSIKPNSI